MLIVNALVAHDGGSYLAEAYAVAPTATIQGEDGVVVVSGAGRGDDGEEAALQVGVGEHAAYLEFLADDVAALGAYDLQLPDASALAALQRDEVGDGAEVDVQFRLQPLGNLAGGDGLGTLPTGGRALRCFPSNTGTPRSVRRSISRSVRRRCRSPATKAPVRQWL